MKKIRIAGLIVVFIGVFVVLTMFSFDMSEKTNDGVYHITLANPDLYQDGIFTDSFAIKNGNYEFRFTPNGDSPEILSIKLSGNSFFFSEDFELRGTPHETGTSLYYTWDYLGEKKIEITEEEVLRIEINPHNNIIGPVSVELIRI